MTDENQENKINKLKALVFDLIRQIEILSHKRSQAVQEILKIEQESIESKENKK